jgi:hypothetical protein
MAQQLTYFLGASVTHQKGHIIIIIIISYTAGL